MGVLSIAFVFRLINRVRWPENLRIRGHMIGLGSGGDVLKPDLTKTACGDRDWLIFSGYDPVVFSYKFNELTYPIKGVNDC
jgi:hypothetical protein